MSFWVTSCHSETPSSSPWACLSSSSPVIVRMAGTVCGGYLGRGLGTGTESTPSARAQEAARLVGQFVGDLCVVALASEDRRTLGPFAIESANPAITELMRKALGGAKTDRASWPLAGRALATGTPVVIDDIRPGELEGIVNPAMDGYLAKFGVSAL